MTQPTEEFSHWTTFEEERATDWRLWLSRSPFVLWTLVVALTAALFIGDLVSPLGFSVWILYIVVVLLAAQRSEPAYTRAMALATTLLIIAGFFFCSEDDRCISVASGEQSIGWHFRGLGYVYSGYSMYQGRES